MTSQAADDELITVVRELHLRGLNRGSSGNCSVRVPQERYLITPSGIPSMSVDSSMLIRGEIGGEEPATSGRNRASSEWRFHRDIYRSRPEVLAIVHVHSVYATSLSCLRRDIPPFHYMVAVAGGADIRCAPYATYGTAELSANVLQALRDRTACLMANHGLITVGSSLADALDVCTEVEALAQQFMIALAAGEPRCLTDQEMIEVIGKFASYRQQKRSVMQ